MYTPQNNEASEGLQQAASEVQFDHPLLYAAVDELLSLRPDALGLEDGAQGPHEDELAVAVGQALAVAAGLHVANEKLDPVEEVRRSGLFSPDDDRALTRFKALALDHALTQAVEVSIWNQEMHALAQKTLASVREFCAAQSGCDDVNFWNHPRFSS